MNHCTLKISYLLMIFFMFYGLSAPAAHLNLALPPITPPLTGNEKTISPSLMRDEMLGGQDLIKRIPREKMHEEFAVTNNFSLLSPTLGIFPAGDWYPMGRSTKQPSEQRGFITRTDGGFYETPYKFQRDRATNRTGNR